MIAHHDNGWERILLLVPWFQTNYGAFPPNGGDSPSLTFLRCQISVALVGPRGVEQSRRDRVPALRVALVGDAPRSTCPFSTHNRLEQQLLPVATVGAMHFSVQPLSG